MNKGSTMNVQKLIKVYSGIFIVIMVCWIGMSIYTADKEFKKGYTQGQLDCLPSTGGGDTSKAVVQE